MNKGLILAVAAVVSIAAALPARAAEGIITYKSLAPDTAFDLARAALNQCRKDGYQVTVAVLDRFGAPLVELRDRYAPVATLGIARGKAWTAVTFNRDTGEFVKAIKDGTISSGLVGLPQVTPLVGGLVIEAGGSLLGGVGVAGAPRRRQGRGLRQGRPRRGAGQARILISDRRQRLAPFGRAPGAYRPPNPLDMAEKSAYRASAAALRAWDGHNFQAKASP